MEKSHTSQKKTPRAERVQAAYGVHVDGLQGRTRDISVSGLYVELPEAYEIGAKLNLTVDYSLDNKTLHLPIYGEVVRVEKSDGRIGLAIKVISDASPASN